MLLEEKEMAERKVKEVSELVQSQAADFDRTRQGTFQSNALEFIYACKSMYHTLICIYNHSVYVAMKDRLNELEEGMNTKQEVISKLMRAQERDGEVDGSSTASQEEIAMLEQECRELRGQLRTLLLASPGIHI